MFRQPFNWREIERLRRDMDRLFESSVASRLPFSRGANFPAVNIWTNEDVGVIVTAELPGMSPEDINITVTADTLTLSGTRSPEETQEGTQYHRRERYCDAFGRTVQLPYTINTSQVDAAAENGVLIITLPRAEAEKPRQISVQASA